MVDKNKLKLKGREYPEPDYCILDMINAHLKVTDGYT